jgi:hypothetical protein
MWMRSICAALVIGLALAGACEASRAAEHKRIAPQSNPGHGEITRVPGFDGLLPSK